MYASDIIFFDGLINEFLAMDSRCHRSHAALVWPKILALAYPFLVGKSLRECLLLLVIRGRRNQCTNGLQDFVEVFAGCANLTLELLRANFHGSAFDILFDSERQNALASNGLRLLIDSISSVKYGGLIWIATKCSSFVVLCRCQSQRNAGNSFLGDTSREFVRNGNCLMEVTALMYVISFLLGLWPVVEQPGSSVMFDCVSMKIALDFARSHHCSTYLGQFSGPSEKRLKLWSSSPVISMLQRAKPMDFIGETLARRHGDGDRQFTGDKEKLLESQQYTREFGKAFAEMCKVKWRH